MHFPGGFTVWREKTPGTSADAKSKAAKSPFRHNLSR